MVLAWNKLCKINSLLKYLTCIRYTKKMYPLFTLFSGVWRRFGTSLVCACYNSFTCLANRFLSSKSTLWFILHNSEAKTLSLCRNSHTDRQPVIKLLNLWLELSQPLEGAWKARETFFLRVFCILMKCLCLLQSWHALEILNALLRDLYT